MANVYYNGLLIAEEDWDYELKKPKKEVVQTETAAEATEESISLS